MLDPDRTIARTSRAGGVGDETIDATKATRTASEEKRAARTENQESWRRDERRLFNLVDVLIFIWVNDT
jgi:hypothetical protein